MAKCIPLDIHWLKARIIEAPNRKTQIKMVAVIYQKFKIQMKESLFEFQIGEMKLNICRQFYETRVKIAPQYMTVFLSLYSYICCD